MAYKKPPRIYPNAQVILGIRGHFVVGGPGVAAGPGKSVVLGTLPAGAFITAANGSCSAAFAGMTTPVVDVGLMDPAGVITAQGLIAAFDVSAPGVVAGAGAQLGYQATEMQVVAKLGGTGTPSAGTADVVVQFYGNRD